MKVDAHVDIVIFEHQIHLTYKGIETQLSKSFFMLQWCEGFKIGEFARFFEFKGFVPPKCSQKGEKNHLKKNTHNKTNGILTKAVQKKKFLT